MSEIRKAFAEMFKPWRIELPANAETSASGEVPNTNGWCIEYRCGSDNRGKYMNIHAAHRMTNARLIRFYEDGTVECIACDPEGIFIQERADSFDQKLKECGFDCG